MRNFTRIICWKPYFTTAIPQISHAHALAAAYGLKFWIAFAKKWSSFWKGAWACGGPSGAILRAIGGNLNVMI